MLEKSTMRRVAGPLTNTSYRSVDFHPLPLVARRTAKLKISGRARLLPSRKDCKIRLSRSFALPFFTFPNHFATLLRWSLNIVKKLHALPDE
jgi:hypothetical protein